MDEVTEEEIAKLHELQSILKALPPFQREQFRTDTAKISVAGKARSHRLLLQYSVHAVSRTSSVVRQREEGSQHAEIRLCFCAWQGSDGTGAPPGEAKWPVLHACRLTC